MVPQQKDQYLGGWIAAGFFLAGAPAAVIMGWVGGSRNRCTLVLWVVIAGAIIFFHHSQMSDISEIASSLCNWSILVVCNCALVIETPAQLEINYL